MPLSRIEFERMEYLLGKSRLEGLSFQKEAQLPLHKGQVLGFGEDIGRKKDLT